MAQAVFKDISDLKKANRRYRLTIQDIDDDRNPIGSAVVIENPFTLKFSINRSIFSEVNQGDFEIYNLAPETYNRLFFDYYSINQQINEANVGNPWNNRLVILEAGYYGMEMDTIFVGDMWSCYTERKGPNIITKIHSIVGLRAMAKTSDITLKNVTRNEVLSTLARDAGLKINIYSGEDTKFSRPVVINGNTVANIQKYSNGTAFIDNEEIKVLELSDATEGSIPLINDESGLLGVPKRENGLLTVDMTFEPRIIVGQVIEIQSRISPMFNGQYKVYGIKHEGTISDSIAGNVNTELQMLVGSQLYGRFGIVKAQY